MTVGLSPLSFTVEVRSPDGLQSLGTGFLVSQFGDVLTAFHVVEPYFTVQQQVRVRFPRVRSEVKEVFATYKSKLGLPEDDLIILSVQDPALELPDPPPIGSAKESPTSTPFQLFGYSEFGDAAGIIVQGEIVGIVPHRSVYEGNDLIQLATRNTAHGLSGAAVIDRARNLVVGVLISRVRGYQDEDTAHAVDLQVLLESKVPTSSVQLDQPTQSTARQSIDEMASILAKVISGQHKDHFGEAPAPFREFVRRGKLLESMERDWFDKDVRVIALSGIGGQGKTSVARCWLDARVSQSQGCFWWSCYTAPDPEKLLSRLAAWLVHDKIDLVHGAIEPSKLRRGSERVNFILAALKSVRVAIVIDGLEVLQQASGDRFGDILHGDLREILIKFCTLSSESRILVTTRCPLSDLAGYPSFQLRPLTPLEPGESVQLLRNYGVTRGSEAALESLARLWNGHALTLSLVGCYIRNFRDGNPSRAEDIRPAGNETLFDKLEKVLRSYEYNLSNQENSFLTVLAAFRTPVGPEMLKTVIRKAESVHDPAWQLSKLGSKEVAGIIRRLMSLSLIRATSKRITLHPLIEDHYRTRLSRLKMELRVSFHRRICAYYESIAIPPDRLAALPSLDELRPWIEIIHHQCQAHLFDDAYRTYSRSLISKKSQILHRIGANKARLEILGSLVGGDRDDTLSNPSAMGVCLSWYGYCLEDDGNLSSAIRTFSKALRYFASAANCTLQFALHANIMRACLLSGDFVNRANAAKQIIERIGQWAGTADRVNECSIYRTLIHHEAVQGHTLAVTACSKEIARLGFDPFDGLLMGQSTYFETLRRQGRAKEITDTLRERLADSNLSMSAQIAIHRALADAGSSSIERQFHYDSALLAARKTSLKITLMSVLSARGRFYAQFRDPEIARVDLDEAFDICAESGCRFGEADVRVGLAWLHKSLKEWHKADDMAVRAHKLGSQIGSRWVQEDAKEIARLLGPSTVARLTDEHVIKTY